MTKLDIVKSVATVASSLAVGKVTHDVIANNVSVDSTEDKIKVAVGTFVIGGMIAQAASHHVHASIDDMAKIWRNRKTVKKSTDEVVEGVIANAA